MEKIIFICGLYSAGFALFHLFFWKLFNWKRDIPKLNYANRGILQILNVQLIFYFLFVAFLCFVFPVELLTTLMGRFILGSCSLFWLIRTIQQFIFFRRHYLFVHLLTLIFLGGVLLFAWPLLP